MSARPDNRALSFDAHPVFSHLAVSANLSNLCKYASKSSLPSTNVGSLGALARSSLSRGRSSRFPKCASSYSCSLLAASAASFCLMISASISNFFNSRSCHLVSLSLSSLLRLSSFSSSSCFLLQRTIGTLPLISPPHLWQRFSSRSFSLCFSSFSSSSCLRFSSFSSCSCTNTSSFSPSSPNSLPS